MGTDSSILKKAISEVDQECSYLCAERHAFQEFRDSVRLVQPVPKADIDQSKITEGLREAYREEVMEVLDHKAIYGDTLAESLEQELSPAFANVLLSDKPFTQRRKRNLLEATTAAIERREQFYEELDDERDALETFADRIEEVESIIDKLPECSAQYQPLEKLLVIWEVYDTLEEQCERLLEQRQHQIQAAERSPHVFSELHALNEYLYGELETSYPVLTSLAAAVERLNSNRTGQAASETMDRPRTY